MPQRSERKWNSGRRRLSFERLDGRLLLSAVPWEGEACAADAPLGAAGEADAVSPEVVAVDVPAAAPSSVGVSFSETVNLPALIAAGTATQAITLLDVSMGPLQLTTSQLQYDAGTSALTVTLDTPLLVGEYELRLDGSLITDTAGNGLLGGYGGLVSDLPAFAAPVTIQAGGVNLSVTGYSVPSMADWDSDGASDLIVGEKTTAGEGKVRVYRNSGTDEAPVFGAFVYAKSGGSDLSVPGGGCLGVFPRLYDWDADGLGDLVLGLADGTVQVALNNGTETEPQFAAPQAVEFGAPGAKVPIDVGLRATLDIYDWNNDLRDDLIVGGYDGKVHVFLNAADWDTPDFRSDNVVLDGSTELVVPSGRASVAVTDLDWDGRKDLVVGNTDGQLLLYANTGTDAEPAFSGYQLLRSAGVAIDLPETPRTRPFAWDYNSDGYTDLLVGSADGLVRLYLGVDPLQAEEPGGIYSYGFRVESVTTANPWTNAEHPLDVNHDERITALDVLVLVNYLNEYGPGTLPVPPTAPFVPPPYLDPSGNGDVTALDALLAINELNAHGPSDLSSPGG
jgi:hypothetical protein